MKPRRSDCLLLARLEDPVLKGAPLACQIITELNSKWSWRPSSKRPKLILRGFAADTFETERNSIDGIEAAGEFVKYRPYTNEEDDIAGDICAASAVIMPSKQEGFGLAALEAIAAGIPTVISSESGLAELLLSKKISGIDGIANKYVADVIGEPSKIVNDWTDRVASIFNDPRSAFDDAAKLRNALAPVLTWERAARALTEEMESLLLKT
jgi:glycosyltransferase involved in cell wall biosynthesis